MSQPIRTQNAAQTAANTSNAADRQFAVQEKIREIQRANPGMSYDEAYAAARTSPDMLQTFNSMEKPAEIPDPFRVQELSDAQRKAGAKFRGLAQAAANQRGISFTEAWNSIREEEPELHASMVGQNDPEKRIKDSMGWRD